ncbi:MAG: hypothetical protein HYX27_11465 [Acidobacteria bacterium]|nr:hypothetical protein [Acidobacteriota bacterium]
MRQDAEFFDDRELDLIYIGKRLAEAQALEALLTEAGWDYYVEADEYSGGILFVTKRTGAFFYVLLDKAPEAREFLKANGYKPQPALPSAATSD